MEDIAKLRNLIIMKGSLVFHAIEKGTTQTEGFNFNYLNHVTKFAEKDLDSEILTELLINGISIQREYKDNQLIKKTVIFCMNLMMKMNQSHSLIES